jgi:peptidoglycan L-alanyl-D-glutamate endopeptidase CwlK
VRKFSQRSLDSLKGVHPDLVRVIAMALHTSPVDFVVIEGTRTKARQEQLFKEGATRTMNSRHLYGLAVDLMPIDPKTGKGSFDWPLYHKMAPAVLDAARSLGISIEWGGNWTTFKDGPHFELTRAMYPDNVQFVPIDPMSIAPPEKPSEPQEVAPMPDTVKIEEGPQKAFAGGAAVYVLEMLREMGIDLGPLAPILESNTGMALIVGGVVWYIANSKRKVIE